MVPETTYGIPMGILMGIPMGWGSILGSGSMLGTAWNFNGFLGFPLGPPRIQIIHPGDGLRVVWGP